MDTDQRLRWREMLGGEEAKMTTAWLARKRAEGQSMETEKT